ncbi:uncharacterized protein LOC144449430 [Glandiceps talaboti]
MMTSVTPQTMHQESADECFVCGFSFLDDFVNSKGKVVKGNTRKRKVKESDCITLSTCLDVTVSKQASVCIVCQSLTGKLLKCINTVKEVKETLKAKLQLKTLTSQKRSHGTPTEIRPSTPSRKRPHTSTFVPQSPSILVVEQVMIPPLPPGPQGKQAKTGSKKTARQSLPLPSEKTQIQITIVTPSATRDKIIDPVFHKAARAIVAQDTTTLVKTAIGLNTKALCQHLVPVIEREVNAVCSVQFNSVLCKTTREGLHDFSFEQLFEECRTVCPVVFAVICAAININILVPTYTDKYRFGCVISPILKTRSKHMSALAYHIGFILKNGGLSERSHKRLTKMGYAVSPSSVDTKVKQLSVTEEEDTVDMVNVNSEDPDRCTLCQTHD